MKVRTNTEDQNRRQGAGFTLMEMMVAVLVGSIVIAAVIMLLIFTVKSFVAIGNYDNLDRRSRVALDQLSRDIRQATALTDYRTNQLTFQDANGGTLIYRWNPSTEEVTRETDVSRTVVLTGCDFLLFGIYQRNPSNNFGFYPATNTLTGKFEPGMCKLIDVSWRCSRRIYGQKVNTESVQTAKIVIRN